MLETAKYILSSLADTGWRSLMSALVAGPSLFLVSNRPQIGLPDFLAEATDQPAPFREHRIPAEPAIVGTHWQQVAASIEHNIDTAEHAARLQSDARTQLDAAEFTLAQLMRDLADIMPLQVKPIIVPRQPMPAFKPALAA